MTTRTSKTTTNHDEIRKWAESRHAKPACVKGTGSKGDAGMIRLDFPGYSGANSLEEISWDEWFEAFDENELALVYQDTTADGEKSNFNKLVGRETARERTRGNSHASRDSSRATSSKKQTSARTSSHTSSRSSRPAAKKRTSSRAKRTTSKKR